jgi:hypothetical protein
LATFKNAIPSSHCLACYSLFLALPWSGSKHGCQEKELNQACARVFGGPHRPVFPGPLSQKNKGEDAAVSLMEKPRDIIGGLVVMTIGTGFLMFGRELAMGTSLRMGPGYFPTILSVVMIALGAAIAIQGLRGTLQENSFGSIPWRGLALIIGAPLVFGATLHGLGLAPAVLMVVLGTAWASRYAGVRSSVALSLGIAAFCSLLFIRLLGLPLPLTGPWLSAEYWSPASLEEPAPAAPAESQ